MLLRLFWTVVIKTKSAFRGKEMKIYCTENPMYVCIPRNETARPRSKFLQSCICEQDRSAYLPEAKKIGRPFLGINKSLTDTRMWKLGDRKL